MKNILHLLPVLAVFGFSSAAFAGPDGFGGPAQRELTNSGTISARIAASFAGLGYLVK